MSQSTIETVAVPCPRCQKPLIDPNGLGWCKACGYCRSLAESEAKAAEASKPAAPTTVGATSSAIFQTPTWFWVTLGGIVLVAGGTFALGNFLTLAPLQRALLTTVEIGLGAVIMFIGQLIGVTQIAPDESTLNFKDAVFPFRLYGLVLKRLPSTRHTVYLGAWGLAAIVSAAVFVGGLEHWFTQLPGYHPSPLHKKGR